jgi:hypothetical protein
MATTTNYGWTKPVVGGDLDVWGAEINTDLDNIDAVVHGIDTRVIPAASSTAPAMDGAAAVGTGTTYARADHVHPTDTTRAAVSAIPAPSSSTPLMDGTAAAGTGAAYARSDHVHPVDVSRYAASNPSNFITAAGAPVQSVAGRTGAITLTHTDITDWTSALSGYALVGSGAQPSTVAPVMDGVATVGVGTTFARSDHIHPSDSSKYSTTNPSAYINAAQAKVAVTDGSNAAAGNIGEYVSVTQSTNVALPQDTPRNITSLPLAAGDWDVDAIIAIGFTNSGSDAGGALTTTSATWPTASFNPALAETAADALFFVQMAISTTRFSSAGATTVYLVGQAHAISGSTTGQGMIRARRVR